MRVLIVLHCLEILAKDAAVVTLNREEPAPLIGIPAEPEILDRELQISEREFPGTERPRGAGQQKAGCPAASAVGSRVGDNRRSDPARQQHSFVRSNQTAFCPSYRTRRIAAESRRAPVRRLVTAEISAPVRAPMWSPLVVAGASVSALGRTGRASAATWGGGSGETSTNQYDEGSTR
jgi:hypothetical protein